MIEEIDVLRHRYRALEWDRDGGRRHPAPLHMRRAAGGALALLVALDEGRGRRRPRGQRAHIRPRGGFPDEPQDDRNRDRCNGAANPEAPRAAARGHWVTRSPRRLATTATVGS